MGFYLLPVAVLSFFLGIIAMEKTNVTNTLPPAIATQAEQGGQTFVAYRNAVAVYQQAHPTFTGSVTSAILAAQGNQFSPAFLALAGNAITATGTAGRIITCYAALPPASITYALDATQNDASLGMASGTTWTSFAQVVGFTPTPVLLATPVPNGNVVSVIQIGT